MSTGYASPVWAAGMIEPARSRAPLAALLLVLVGAPVLADDDQDRVLRWRQEGRILPLERILEGFDPERRLQIIGIELEEEDGRPVYEIKYLDPRGRIRETEIDASTGTVVKAKGH